MTPLSDDDVATFERDGAVRLDDAFDAADAAAMRAILWAEMGLSPDRPQEWAAPVVRLGGHHEPPFVRAATGARLEAAYDQLVGVGNWQRMGGLGTFPIRFPSPDPPGDDGWHIDVSFALPDDDPADFMGYRANIASRGRALLVLFLLSDVGPDDAPTRIALGSQRDVARLLAPAGDEGLTLRELVAADFGGAATRPQALAMGPAGTAWLCHPFLVHGAQPLRLGQPRFIAQPPLLPAGENGIVAETPNARAIGE